MVESGRSVRWGGRHYAVVFYLLRLNILSAPDVMTSDPTISLKTSYVDVYRRTVTFLVAVC